MFWEKFTELCSIYGVKPARVCREIGVSYNSASNWKARGTTPNREVLHKLEEYFNVGDGYFFTDRKEPQEEEMSRQRKTALDLIDQVPEDKLQRVIDFVSGLLS